MEVTLLWLWFLSVYFILSYFFHSVLIHFVFIWPVIIRFGSIKCYWEDLSALEFTLLCSRRFQAASVLNFVYNLSCINLLVFG